MNDDDETDDGLPDPASFQPPGLRYRFSDVGNANRFHDRFGKDVRWSQLALGDGLLVWDGNRWLPDEMKKTLGLAQAVALDIVTEAEEAWALVRDLEAMAKGQIPVDDPTTLASRTKSATSRAKQLSKWANQTEMSGKLKAIVEVALPGIAVPFKSYDASPWLFNAYGGTIDLQTGELHSARRADLLTKIADVTIDQHADCPQWLAFLFRIMGGDPSLPESDPKNVNARELVAFLQRAVGYCLTGTARDQCMFICYGASGGNGKSTFLDVLRAVFGDYAMHTRAETFMKDARKSGIPNDVAALRGSRLVTASEPEQGAVLDESVIKEMTGDNAMTARFLNHEFFTFQPTFKVWLATNHRPIIRSTSRAIWRRLMMIPFDVEIPEDQWDRVLVRKLLDERAGILRWAVQGCGMWLCGDALPDGTRTKPGLRPPATVLAAIADYRKDMDLLAEFISERCVLGADERVGNTDIYKAFAAWQKDVGENPRSQKWLTRALLDRSYRREGRKDLGQRWEGIGLRKIAVADDQQPGRWPPPRDYN